MADQNTRNASRLVGVFVVAAIVVCLGFGLFRLIGYGEFNYLFFVLPLPVLLFYIVIRSRSGRT